MRLFVEGQKIICKKKDHLDGSVTYSIDNYFLKQATSRQVEILLDQAITENLKVKIWEDVKKGRPNEVWITNLTRSATFDGKRGIDFTILYASRPKSVRRPRQRAWLDWL